MVVLTAAALLLGGVLTYFTIGALATLAHWVSVAGAFVVFAGLTWTIIDDNLFEVLGFESELFESLSAAVFSSAVAVLSFRLFESLFAVAGFGLALAGLVLAVSVVVFGAGSVAAVLGTVIGEVLNALGGDE